jgi:hypothetical protein
MSASYNSLSDDWGWYVDIESINTNNQITADLKLLTYKQYRHHINLETIEEEEDEYDYYMSNHKDDDDIVVKNVDIKNNSKNILFKKIFNVGSTTMITALLTYIIFYML